MNHYSAEFRARTRKLLENFDAELQIFYHDVICRELDLTSARNVAAVKQAMKEVVNAYKKDTVDSKTSSILYDTPEKRCAYVLKHCPCFGSAVARHFLQLLRENPLSLQRVLQKRRINLCCLGGGPGTEAVALAKVLSHLDKTFNGLERRKSKEDRLDLRIQVVDLSGDWRTTAESVFRRLNETSGTILDSEVGTVVSFQLLQADLTKEQWEKPVKRVLGEADVITMVYFVSAVNGSRAQDRCSSMLKNIMEVAKPECLLFFLDSAKELHYKAVHSATYHNNKVRQIYGPFLQEFHTLSIGSIKKFIELYFDHFSSLLCLTNCFITSAGWIKLGNETAAHPEQQPPCCYRISANRWKKAVEFNTKRQERFRQRVERIILSEMKMDFVVEDDLKDNSWDVFSLDSCQPPPCKFYATKSKEKRIFTS